MQTADVVLYDRLVSPAILTSTTARTCCTGKQAGFHTRTQDEIEHALGFAARAPVVRLKGGDLLVFGRGGEEMETRWPAARRADRPRVAAAAGASWDPLTHSAATSRRPPPLKRGRREGGQGGHRRRC